MLQSISSVFIVYRLKTLTGSPDPTHANGMDKPCNCQLWELYADALCELTAKSKISQQEAAKACKVHRPYIHDVLDQIDAVMTLFVMEKELRSLKGKGHFPIPKITPKGTRIENPHHVRKTLEAVDEEVTQMLNTIRENEIIQEKEKEEARI